MSGFSIENNLLANTVNLELDEHQQTLGTSVRNLSSGLRVNTAADDPSGNAIATSLQTHAQAFTQAAQNVSNAQNAAAVADGALGEVTDVLLRIRELAINASSSIDSTADRTDIQAEINQLLLEINRIAQNTNFNGRALLDGSIAGYQPAQVASATIEANSVLLGNASTTNSTSNFLLASASVLQANTYPAIATELLQAATAGGPQTLKVSDASLIQPGQPLSWGDALVNVISTDPANNTITATFDNPVPAGADLSALIQTNSTNAVAAGLSVMTLATVAPLYAGEALQIDPNNATVNDVVVVQKVLSPTSFLAYFNKAQPADVSVYAGNNLLYFGGKPGKVTIASFGGGPADGPPSGSPAWVLEQAQEAYQPTEGAVEVVQTGVVTKITPTAETIELDGPVPDLFGGYYQLISNAGDGNTPLVTPEDGTIKLTVVNQSGTIGVQESFYDTALQTSVTSPYLLAPGESAMLYDGVITTVGDFTAADVGSTAYIKVLQATNASLGASTPPLTVQSGSDEGDVIQIGIPAVNTNTLRISTVTVIGASGADPTFAAEDAIGQLDFALQQVTTLRAQVGAQIVKLGIDQTNDDTAQTELTASASNITDLDVGEASTGFTEQQIDVQVATNVLEQVNTLTDAILKLFPDAGGAP